MGRLTRAGLVIVISLAPQPAMLILGFYAVFPDYFKSPYPFIALLVAISIIAGSSITKGIDIFTSALVSAGTYMILFRLFLAWFIGPYLYDGFEAYSLLTSIFLPGFFYFFVYLFVEVLCLFLGSRIGAYRNRQPP